MDVGRMAALGAVCAAALAAGCGSGGGGGGPPPPHLDGVKGPGGPHAQAVANCNKEAAGKYRTAYQALPADANQQRELLVRRLAAKASSVALVGADVIWTAEFAQAGWIKPWTGSNRARAVRDRLAGPL